MSLVVRCSVDGGQFGVFVHLLLTGVSSVSFFPRRFQFGVFWLFVVVGGVRSMSLFVVLLTGVSSVSFYCSI